MNFSIDKESYGALEKQLDRLDTVRVQSVETVSSLKVLKSRPLKDVHVPSIYKAVAPETERTAQSKIFFTDVGQLQLSLEAEGSTAETAATVSKVSTGTGPSTPISTSRTSTQTLSCTQTVRKVITHTKDGIQEKYEKVNSGPGCDTIEELGISQADLISAAKDGKGLTVDGFTVKVTGGDSKSITSLSGDGQLGGLGGDFFKGLGSSGQDRKLPASSTSSSSSSSSSKSLVTSGSKGFVSDTKTTKTSISSPDFSDDLGAFFRGDIEDDLPDLHARSLKSHDDRKADFIGGGTLE